MIDRIWSNAEDSLTLSPGEARIWRIEIADAIAEAGTLERTLAEDERRRAARFRLPRESARFVGLRGILRSLLGASLGEPPESLRFVYGPRGKPALDPDSHDSTLRFNLSHTSDVALIALTQGREIGIDLERIRPITLGIAERFFTPEEVDELRALPPEERQPAFFTIWVRKEALVKARGEGIAGMFHRFAVSLGLGEPPTLREPAGPVTENLRGWMLYDPAPIPGHAVALAVEGSLTRVRCWRWRLPQTR